MFKFPRVLYYLAESMTTHLVTFPYSTAEFHSTPTPTLAALGTAGAARIVTTVLVLQHENHRTLGALTDQELAELEKSISHLDHSSVL